MSSAMPLYRSLLRTSRTLPDYNFRSYTARRITASFKANKSLAGEDATKAIANGKAQLDMLRRQGTIGQLYPQEKNVMETLAEGMRK